MHPDQTEFAKSEVKRWVTSGFAREATDVEERELRRAGTVFPAFVTETSSKARLVVDYKRENECMQTRTFRMSQVSDLAATLTRNDALFKCDIKRRTLPSASTAQRPAPTRVCGLRKGILSTMSELRSGGSSVVLHQGYVPCCWLPEKTGPQSFVLPRRFLRFVKSRSREHTGKSWRHKRVGTAHSWVISQTWG